MNIEWTHQPLGQLALRIADGSHNPPKGIEKSEFMMLSSKNVFDDELSFEAPRYLSASDFEVEDRRTSVTAGDVLLTIVGTIGRTAVVPMNAPAFTLQRSVAVIRPDQSLIDSRFLMYALMSRGEALNAQARGVAQKGVYLEALREFTISRPPLSEQCRIVAILDEAFDGIATAKAHADRNLRNAREVFERQLQATFDSKVATWPIHRLGALCTQVTDGTHKSPAYVETGVPMLDSKHIGDGFEIDDSRAEKFIAPDVDAQLAQRCKPSEGDILISSRGTIGKIAIVKAGQDFNIMGNMILLRLPSSVDRHFIAFYVLSRVAHIESIARGVAQKGLYLGQVRDYEVPVPSLDEQRRIAKRLRCLQAESARLCGVMKRKLAALDELKQSLLHQAFSGQL